jgi:hypothetical protein
MYIQKNVFGLTTVAKHIHIQKKLYDIPTDKHFINRLVPPVDDISMDFIAV